MTKGKKQTKTRTKSATPKKPQESTAQSTVVRWEAREHAPQKYWWWWAALILVTLLLAWWMWSIGYVTTAILVVVLSLALAVTYGAQSRSYRYQLEGSTLQATVKEATVSIELENYASAYLDDPWTSGKATSPTEILVFLPKAKFAPARPIILPEDAALRDKVVDRLVSQVPLLPEGEVNSYRQRQRFLSWIARKVGL